METETTGIDDLYGVRWGPENQLELLGFTIYQGPTCKTKYYRVICHICKNDPELNGEAMYTISRSNFRKGYIPCGCSKTEIKTEHQWKVIIGRKFENSPYKFMGFRGDFKGLATKCIMVCPAHGVWDNSVLANIIHRDSLCSDCRYESNAWKQRLTDEEAKELFLASGAFHPETKFWRSDRKNKAGRRPYWFIECYECGEVRESFASSLQLGAKPCYCGRHNPNYGYISNITDNGVSVGLKFGISSRPLHRVQEQDKKSVYSIALIKLYKFDSVIDCRNSETQIKKTLECGIFSPEEIPDGYTETTFTYNLEAIMEIYNRNGGVEEGR